MSDTDALTERTDIDDLLRAQAALVRSAQRCTRGGGRRSSAVGLALLIGAWYVLSRLWAPRIFPTLPGPTQVAVAVWRELASGRMLPHILVTAEEVVVGLAAGALLGVMMSALVAEFGVLRAFFVSHVMPSQTVPIATLAPILILWMGFEGGPKIALAALITFFPVLEHAVVGLRGSGLGPGMSGAAAHAPRWQSLWRFRFPHSIPFIVAGLRAAACPVIIGVVVGEYLGGERGLGYLMINAVNALNATLSLAVFVLIVVMSVGFYHALNGIERRLFERSWTGRERIASTMS